MLAAEGAAGGGVSVGAGEGAASKVGSSALQSRALGGLHDDLGSNPAAEDKTMHEGDAAEQAKKEKKDKRDAEPDTSKGKQAKPTLADAVPPPGSTFDDWFDALTLKDLREFLADGHARKLIEAAIRHPRHHHEWLMVKHVEKFKEWGVSMKLIKEARTLTKETLGKNFIHGGKGSGTMHIQLSKMIESSGSFEEFLQKLNLWADEELFAGTGVPGRFKLPEGLQR